MADKPGISDFIRVRPARIPDYPEDLADPKQALVNAARKSKSKSIREAMVPREGVGASEGPEFSTHMIEFTYNHWSIERSLLLQPDSSSFARAIRCLGRLVEEASKPEHDLA
ncbi:MAG: hypothetical protein U1C74_29080 [Phenylobacterium sp.]|nr:hypothetical protein [Phenylobacterium sp.]